MSQQTVVTKEWLTAKIAENPEHVIGRALVAIFKRQTLAEQSSSSTIKHNGVGFTGPDARFGSFVAKYFIKHGTLKDWHVRVWTKPNKKGQPRIVKYAKQLNEIANG